MFRLPCCAITVLLGMRGSRVESISPRTLAILSYNFGTSSEVSSWEGVFYTPPSLGTFFLGHMENRFPLVHAVILFDTLLLTRNGRKVQQKELCRAPAFRAVRVRCTDRSFDWNDVDFLLFGVATEEIRWLQSGVVVPRVTVRPLRQWARRESRSRARHCGAPVLCARSPVDLHGHLPSLGSCARRVGDVPRSPRVVPSTKSSRFQSSSSGRLRGRSATRSSTPSMGTRWPRPPGLLPGASDSEFTSPTTTTWNRRWSGAAADEPGRPHTDLEARLERLFVRGRHPCPPGG